MTAISRTPTTTKTAFTTHEADEQQSRQTLAVTAQRGELARGHFFMDPEPEFPGSEEHAANPIRLTDDGMAIFDSTYIAIANLVDNGLIGMSRSGDRALYGMSAILRAGRP